MIVAPRVPGAWNPIKITVFLGSGSRCIRWCRMRPPVTMPLEETMIAGKFVLLIFFESSVVCAKVKPGHCRGEPYCSIKRQVSSVHSSECLRKTSHCFDRHGAVAVHRHARNLPGLHQLFDHEEKFLGTFDGKCGHDHAAATLHRLADDRGQFRPGIVRGVLRGCRRLIPSPGRRQSRLQWVPTRTTFPGATVLVADAANVSTEQQLLHLTIQVQRELHHRRTQDVGRRDEAK